MTTPKKERRKKYTNAEIKNALIKTNGYITLAARMLGCEPKTIYRRLDKTEALRQTLKDIREQELDITEQKLHQAILNGEPWAITLKLKTLGKSRGYTERTELTGQGNKPITFVLQRHEPEPEED
jgi:transcriptional regulator with GAF, ATPase, and Fis domain